MSGGSLNYLRARNVLGQPDELARGSEMLYSLLRDEKRCHDDWKLSDTQILGLHIVLRSLEDFQQRLNALQNEANGLDGVLNELDRWGSGDSGPDAVLSAFLDKEGR